MGWTEQHPMFWKNGKVDRKAECDTMFNWESEKYVHTVLKSRMYGREYYAAIERKNKESGEREVFAVVCLTSVRKENHSTWFGYKDMDETMGPCYYNCPKGILDLLTETDYEFANKWRETCRSVLDVKKMVRGLPVGTKVEVDSRGVIHQFEKIQRKRRIRHHGDNISISTLTRWEDGMYYLKETLLEYYFQTGKAKVIYKPNM